MAIGMRILGLALGVVVVLATAAPAADEETVKKAIEGGVAYLKRVQQSGGDWRHSQHALGVTALATLAMLECDVDKDDPAIQKAAEFVRQNSLNLSHTYSISLSIMLLD